MATPWPPPSLHTRPRKPTGSGCRSRQPLPLSLPDVSVEFFAAGGLDPELEAVDAVAVAAVVIAGVVAVAAGTKELPSDLSEVFTTILTMRRRLGPSRRLALTRFPRHLTAPSTA